MKYDSHTSRESIFISIKILCEICKKNQVEFSLKIGSADFLNLRWQNEVFFIYLKSSFIYFSLIFFFLISLSLFHKWSWKPKRKMLKQVIMFILWDYNCLGCMILLRSKPVIGASYIGRIINRFNYNLAKYLCNILKLNIASLQSIPDTFAFMKKLEDVGEHIWYMQPFPYRYKRSSCCL